MIPVVGDLVGGTALRGEYLRGTMPGTRASNAPYNAGATATTAPTATREFAGWYVILVQNLGDQVQGVVKYDVFDPNTAVAGSGLGAPGTNLDPPT